MYKQFIIFLFLLSGSMLLHPLITQAHELNEQGSISALLHINPDDSAVVNQPAELLFLITDNEKKFTPENCNCVASITDIAENKIIFSSPLSKSKTSYKGIFAPAISYIFPHKGIYTIKLTGTPITTDLFDSFDLSYNIKVIRDVSDTKIPLKRNLLLYFITILMLVIIVFLIRKLTNKKPS